LRTKRLAQEHYEQFKGESDFSIRERYKRAFPDRVPIPADIYRCLAELWVGGDETPPAPPVVSRLRTFALEPIHRSAAGYSSLTRIDSDDPFEGTGLAPMVRSGYEYERGDGLHRTMTACCGLDVADNPPGCWIQIDPTAPYGVVIPYSVMGSGRDYWANPPRSVADLVDDIQTGTGFVRADYYQRLDKKIRKLWTRRVANGVLDIMDVYDGNGSAAAELVANGSAWKKNVIRMMTLIHRYNAPQQLCAGEAGAELPPRVEDFIDKVLIQVQNWRSGGFAPAPDRNLALVENIRATTPITNVLPPGSKIAASFQNRISTARQRITKLPVGSEMRQRVMDVEEKLLEFQTLVATGLARYDRAKELQNVYAMDVFRAEYQQFIEATNVFSETARAYLEAEETPQSFYSKAASLTKDPTALAALLNSTPPSIELANVVYVLSQQGLFVDEVKLGAAIIDAGYQNVLLGALTERTLEKLAPGF